MSLTDRARASRERADRTGDPGDAMLAAALEATLAAEAQDLLSQLPLNRSTVGTPTPAEEGLVSEVRIAPGEGLN
jgi:hypothetical protein